MACFKRRRKAAFMVALILAMLLLNIVFLADLAINHQAHSHIMSVLQDSLQDSLPGHEGEAGGEQSYTVEVFSSKEEVEILIGGKVVYTGSEDQRGIHVGVLNQATGEVMATKVFDTYMPGAEDNLVVFFNSISDGRVLCLAILDEGTFSLKESGRSGLNAIGSRLSSSLSWRDMWTMVAIKGGGARGEDVGKSPNTNEWGPPIRLTVTLLKSESVMECDWPDTTENARRRHFCSKYEGYGSLCHCSAPLPLTIKPLPLTPNNVADVPVAVIASNRPLYLFRMLMKLLSVAGANPAMVTVFIDGYFQEPMDVTELLGVRVVQHEPKSQKNGRISQHYKFSLSAIFDLYQSASYTIVLEEDLDVAPDFFSYFSQTVGLLEEDQSVYCISAWNDQGYSHSTADPTLLYRVETMPGLGWLLKRKMYKEELEQNWPGPEKLWDWDMWMRIDSIRKGRECVIPDVSRTFHFGASGVNMNPYFHDRYFKKHIINDIPNVTLRDVHSLTKENYEVVIHGLFREARVLDHGKDPCKNSFIPATKGQVYVMYITMNKSNHYDNWMKLAKCFKLWDLDARGFHKGLWRFWLKGNQMLVVGHPYSPYSAKYMPLGVTPFNLTTPTS